MAPIQEPTDGAGAERMAAGFERLARTLGAGARFAAALVGALALWLAMAGAVFAQSRDAELCARATAAAARSHGVPPALLRAVSLVESGRRVDGKRAAWPWTINLTGDGYWFDTREEALDFARAALERGETSFDVGCMQINYRWHGHAFGSLEEMFDPRRNAEYAAEFLIALQRETGDWMRAAGFYHSRTPRLSAKYRGLVSKAYAQATAEPEPELAPAPGPTRRARRRATAALETTPAATPRVERRRREPSGGRILRGPSGPWPGLESKQPLILRGPVPNQVAGAGDGEGGADRARGLVRPTRGAITPRRLETPPERGDPSAALVGRATDSRFIRPVKPFF